jgi:hypothetical protein
LEERGVFQQPQPVCRPEEKAFLMDAKVGRKVEKVVEVERTVPI